MQSVCVSASVQCVCVCAPVRVLKYEEGTDSRRASGKGYPRVKTGWKEGLARWKARVG